MNELSKAYDLTSNDEAPVQVKVSQLKKWFLFFISDSECKSKNFKLSVYKDKECTRKAMSLPFDSYFQYKSLVINQTNTL